ncbi:hypothetical protein OJAV_G00203970 [Oryzias javanicus]|uniref:Ig-like domain-containing protein n=1 Tax=Oryzias javanicus TaxID=123683 RepID=A0A437C5B9_ORYJA|nr:hypothetical protein OJAV_G00203970 [Oryzias javanicus]
MKSFTFFLYSINVINLVTSVTVQYALEGKSISLKTSISAPDPPDEILWKHNGNKVVEFNGQQQTEFSPFEHRLTLNWHTAELEIKKLQFEDSGDYVLEIFSNKNLKSFDFILQVIESVPKPSISCAINGDRNATLTCSAEVRGPHSNLEFSWIPPGKEKSSPKLEIKLGIQKDSEVYECTVRNQKSEESASFTAKDCYPEEGISAGVIAAIILGLLVLTLLVVFFLYRKGYLCKQDYNAGLHDEEKQAASGDAIVVKDNRDGKEERKHLLGREETMPSNQPLPQWKQRDESKKDTKEDLEETQNTKAHPPVAAKPSRASNIHRGDKILPDNFIRELRHSVHQRNLEKQQQEMPSPSPQPPLKPSRSMPRTPNSQSHSEEGGVNGDAEIKPPSNEKVTDVKPASENQLEIPSSPPQPPLKPSRSIARTPKSQSHSKEGGVNGDGPVNESPPIEKTTDVEPGSEKNSVFPHFPVAVEVHSQSTTDTELPNEKELIEETEANVSESDPSGPTQKTGADSDSEKKEKVSTSPPSVAPKPRHASVSRKESSEPAEKTENPEENAPGMDPSVPESTTDVLPDSEEKEKVSTSPPSVAPKPRHASVSRKESSEPAEKTENPEENAPGMDPSVPESTTDVLPGSDVEEAELKQPAFSSETSVSAPAGLPASPLTQKVPKTPPNEAAEREENGSTDQASAESSEGKAEEPEPKDLERKPEAVSEVKTPPPPTPPGAGTQTGAEEDEQLPPAEDDDDAPKENGHFSAHEQDQSLDVEPNENFLTPPNSPTPKQAKAGPDSSTPSKEDEEQAAVSEQKHSQ